MRGHIFNPLSLTVIGKSFFLTSDLTLQQADDLPGSVFNAVCVDRMQSLLLVIGLDLLPHSRAGKTLFVLSRLNKQTFSSANDSCCRVKVLP